MIEVLAPVRSDHDQKWTLEFLAKLHQQEPIRVHLLSVQPRYSGHVRMFVGAPWIHQAQEEDAAQEMAPMGLALQELGIPCERHMVEGSSAEQIVRFAREHHCSQIVLGPPAAGQLSERLFGSLNREVEQLMRLAGEPCQVH